MDLKAIIPAAAAPGREALKLTLTRTDGSSGTRLELHAGGGSASLLLAPKDSSFVFQTGSARLESTGELEGRRFADSVAQWLGLELGELLPVTPQEALDASWARLGRGEDPFGGQWETFKLFFKLGERYAEVFLRLSVDGTGAELVEKWDAYREDLVTILDGILSKAPPRRIRPRALPPVPNEGGELLLSLDEALQFAVPVGFLATKQPEGHFRLTDAAEEMMIEISYMRLPLLLPGAPSVSERVSLLVQQNEHAANSTAVVSFKVGDVELAWSEYRFDSRDTKQPTADKRPARGRTLVAANDWTQALVTGCWWEADVASGEQAWECVVRSLRLGGRIVHRPKAAVES